MGWTGWETYTQEGKKLNYYVGDAGWDLLGSAVDEVKEVYKKAFGRPPTKEELRETLEFVIGKYLENLDTE